MKRHSSLVKKLKAYSALAGVAAVTPLASDAQIIYTNVEPDTVVNFNGTYELDLNSDGLIDFDVHFGLSVSGTWSTFSSRYVEVTPRQQNAIACSYIDSYGESLAQFAKGDTIKSDTLWGTRKNTALYFYPRQGYLGLRTEVNGKYFFGWVRLVIDYNGDYFIVKDYAYEAKDNMPIVAGKILCDTLSKPPSIKIDGDSLRATGSGDIEWYLNGNIIPGYSSNALSPPVQGVYSVIFKNVNGCNAQ